MSDRRFMPGADDDDNVEHGEEFVTAMLGFRAALDATGTTEIETLEEFLR